MTCENVDIKSTRQTNAQLAELLSGFKEVLTQCGVSDSTAIEFTLVERGLDKEGFTVLPQGCKYKCWYNQGTYSTQCGVVCSI
ncbi:MULTISPECIES: hypothetical protein [unclassified Coleofasciculus]|uniref:hypothetical protein n=1 Tax=unclassified Coleofasciculus TaxID=2692782 RepID=UPI00187E8A48|nr:MULTISPECIES: hypothetical protein [unclassified Coleofasciculus]MBE9126750.1 hypothetical protein [Coleofasciculus sp. LEGE 07081]MBE9150121.1 hypothetical protein [Coleofasciculus sp. LEGE 07092]